MQSIRPHVKVWERHFAGGSRAQRFEQVIDWAANLKRYRVDCLVIVDAGYCWQPHQFSMLAGAFEACRISLAAPCPRADGTANMVEMPPRGKRPSRSPLRRMELGFAVFDPAVFRAVSLPLQQPTPEEPFAPDWQICEALGGVAPLRLAIEKPTRTHRWKCTPGVLARVPALLGHAAPTLLGPVDPSGSLPKTTPQP